MNFVFEAIVRAGGRPLLVGGCVRDMMLNIEPKDIDVEVYGMTLEYLFETVREFGKVCVVGQSFGVLKLTLPNGQELDLSIPRRDNKVGIGHKDFRVTHDPHMTPEQGAARRDFTINAMMMDPLTGEVIDPFKGRADLNWKWLHPTSEAFKEDALRVLRGMQFAARFGLRASPECMAMCKEMLKEEHALPVERKWGEWEKWAAKSYCPSMGLQFLRQSWWVKVHPELEALIDCPQDTIWHPEGDVWTHTLFVCDVMANICRRENIVGEDRLVLMFASLCHDLGKPATTKVINGRIRSPGHCEVGVPIAEAFLKSIGCLQRVIDRVLPLVKEHLVHVQNHNARSVRRLALRLQPATMQELVHLIEADYSGRPPLEPGLPDKAFDLLQLASETKMVEKGPTGLIMGRHLLELGVKPGPEMGMLLRQAFEAQMEGEFGTLEEGIAWVKAELV